MADQKAAQQSLQAQFEGVESSLRQCNHSEVLCCSGQKMTIFEEIKKCVLSAENASESIENCFIRLVATETG